MQCLLSTLLLSLILYSTHSATTQSSLLILDLQSTSASAFSSELTEWTKTSSTSPYYYLCGSNYLMGGYSIGGSFSRSYTYLAYHNVIYFSMIIYPLDDWVSEDFLTITIGSLTFQLSGVGRSGPGSPYSSNICGSPTLNDAGAIYAKGKVYHTGPQIDLSFVPTLTYSSNLESYGVREITLRLATEDQTDSSFACFVAENGGPVDSSCVCSSSVTQFFSSSCQTCSPQCQTCANSKSFCTSCVTGFYFDGSDCKKCSSDCVTCSSSSKCTECQPGFYLYSDGSCASTCPSPMTSSSSPVWNCRSSCAAGQYLYWDGTCLTACPYPFVIAFYGNDAVCTNGCSTLLFLYPDATCQAACTGTVNVFKTFSLCNYPCVTPNFIYGNGSCSANCDPPFVSTTYGNIKYCTTPTATPFLYPNSTVSATCTAASIPDYSSGLPSCVNPYPNKYIMQNGSVVTTCNTDVFVKVSVGLVSYCDLKCSYGTYLFTANGTCSSTCNSPFIKTLIGLENYCSSPCGANQFISTSGTCSSTCPSPLISQNSTGYNLCFSTAPTNDYFMLQNLTFVPTCPAPWVYDSTIVYKVCDTPCTTKTHYLTPLSKCLASCSSPLVPIENGYYKFCDTPCKGSTPYYKADTGNCIASCVLPYIVDSDAPIKQCTIPTYSVTVSEVFARINKYLSSSLPLLGTAISSISNGGAGVMAFGIMALSRQLYYMRYFRIEYNQDLMDYLVKTNYSISPSFGVSMPTSWLSLPPYQQLPDRIEGWGLSSKFIYNTWEFLTTIIICTGLLIAVSGFHIYAKRQGLDQEWTFLLRKLSSLLRWNLLLTIFCSSFDSLMIYVVLEFKYYQLDNPTGVFSFILAIITLILIAFFLFLSYTLIQECNQRVLKANFTKKEEIVEDSKKFHLNWQGFHVLFQGYDNENHSIFSQAYIFCFLTRSLLWGLIIVLLNEYPIAQTVMLFTINLSFFIMLIYKKPFTSSVSEVVIPLLELLVVIVDACLVINAIADINPDLELSKFRVGVILRFACDIFNIACFLIVLLYTFLGCNNTSKFYNLALKERPKSLPMILSAPFIGYIINSSQLEGPDNIEEYAKKYEQEESSIVKIKPEGRVVTIANIAAESSRLDDTRNMSAFQTSRKYSDNPNNKTSASEDRLLIDGLRSQHYESMNTKKTDLESSPNNHRVIPTLSEEKREKPAFNINLANTTHQSTQSNAKRFDRKQMTQNIWDRPTPVPEARMESEAGSNINMLDKKPPLVIPRKESIEKKETASRKDSNETVPKKENTIRKDSNDSLPKRETSESPLIKESPMKRTKIEKTERSEKPERTESPEPKTHELDSPGRAISEARTTQRVETKLYTNTNQPRPKSIWELGLTSAEPQEESPTRIGTRLTKNDFVMDPKKPYILNKNQAGKFNPGNPIKEESVYSHSEAGEKNPIFNRNENRNRTNFTLND